MFFSGDSSTRKRVDLGGRSSKERDRQKLLEQTRLERNRRWWLRQQNSAALRIQVCFSCFESFDHVFWYWNWLSVVVVFFFLVGGLELRVGMQCKTVVCGYFVKTDVSEAVHVIIAFFQIVYRWLHCQILISMHILQKLGNASLKVLFSLFYISGIMKLLLIEDRNVRWNAWWFCFCLYEWMFMSSKHVHWVHPDQ